VNIREFFNDAFDKIDKTLASQNRLLEATSSEFRLKTSSTAGVDQRRRNIDSSEDIALGTN